MKFVKLLPPPEKELKIRDVVDESVFQKIIGRLDEEKKAKALNIRDWLKRIIVTSFVIIILLLIVTILSFIN